jgi:hypothetical protein
MEPKWIRQRMEFWLNVARTELEALREAVTNANLLAVCQHAGRGAFALATVPLLRAGITPSSTRGLFQLGIAGGFPVALLAQARCPSIYTPIRIFVVSYSGEVVKTVKHQDRTGLQSC